MSKVARRTLRRLNLEPYSRAVLARGLKARKADDDGEEYEGLERAMEYAGAAVVTTIYAKSMVRVS